MRRLAWFLVAAGLVVAISYTLYAARETVKREERWHHETVRNMDIRELQQAIDKRVIGVVPTSVVVTPWPGIRIGALIAASGLLLLAIRPPIPRVSCSAARGHV